MIYIINLRSRPDKRTNMIKLMNTLLITKFKFIDAVNKDLPSVQKKYNDILTAIAPNFSSPEAFTHFTKWTFQCGAYGCLKSHKKVIKDAIKNNYNTILILEDDVTCKTTFFRDFKLAFSHVPSDWSLLYLGKKQGDMGCVSSDPYSSDYVSFDNIINPYWYDANVKTWGSHAWVINSSIFGLLKKLYSNNSNAVDILVHDLFKKYGKPVYVIKDDLFITSYESDIREVTPYDAKSHFAKWNWKPEHYIPFGGNKMDIRTILIYDFHPDTKPDHTHTYIHTNIYNTFKELYPNLEVLHWGGDKGNEPISLTNCLVFCSPAQGTISGIPKDPSNVFIVHIDEMNNNSTIMDMFEEEINTCRVLFLTCRNYDDYIYNYFSFDNMTLCLPWAASFLSSTNILQNYYKIKNYKKVPYKKSVVYFGSVWDLNYEMIIELATICYNNSYNLTILGRVSNINRIEILKANPNVLIHNYHAYKGNKEKYAALEKSILSNPENLIVSLQGAQHYNTYISCRLFTNIGNGHLGVSNNILSSTFVKSALYYRSIEGLLKRAFSLDITTYKTTMALQMLDVYFNHTYKNRVYDYVDALTTYVNPTITIPSPISGLKKQYIILFGFQRTGSSYICDILDQYDNINGSQEIYQGGKVGISCIDWEQQKSKKIIEERDTNHYTRILSQLEKLVIEPIISFKIFPDNIINITHCFELCANPKTIPLILKRNFIDIYISYKRAQKTKEYAYYNYSTVKIKFSKEDFVPLYYMHNTWYSLLEDYMKNKSITYYEISYENVIKSPNYFTKLFNDIGIDVGQVIGGSIREKQSYPMEYGDVIKNYNEFYAFIKKDYPEFSLKPPSNTCSIC